MSVTPGAPSSWRQNGAGLSESVCGAFPKVDYKLKALVIAVLSQDGTRDGAWMLLNRTEAPAPDLADATGWLAGWLTALASSSICPALAGGVY